MTLRPRVSAVGRQYVLPAALVGLAVWTTRSAYPLASHTPHLLPLLAVIVSARIGRRPAAVFATALSAAAAWWVHASTTALAEPEHAVVTLVYAVVALYIGVSVAAHQEAEVALSETDGQLRRTNDTLSALIDASPIPIISIDASDRVLMWSRAASETFGWTSPEVVGRPYPLVPKGQEQEHRAFAERVLNGETFANIETKRQRRDGTTLDVIIATAPIRNSDGVIDRTLGMLFDTTTRRRAERELRASEERYRSLFSAIQEGVVLHELVRDREGRPIDYRILSANPGFEANTGLPVKGVIGRLASETYGNGTAPYLEQYAAVVESGAPVTFETTFAPLRRTFSISVYKTDDNGFATVFQDLTERRRLEQQFRQAQKMEAIGRLAGGVAHDFNNLLTAILGFSELALADLPADSRARRDIEEIKKAGETAAAVTRAAARLQPPADPAARGHRSQRRTWRSASGSWRGSSARTSGSSSGRRPSRRWSGSIRIRSSR